MTVIDAIVTQLRFGDSRSIEARDLIAAAEELLALNEPLRKTYEEHTCAAGGDCGHVPAPLTERDVVRWDLARVRAETAHRRDRLEALGRLPARAAEAAGR